MKIKTLNFILRTLLMIVGIGIGTFTFLFARSYGPANYEIVDVDIKIPYEFSRFDGKKIQSNYIVAIHKNKLVAYDPEYKNSSDFKESYLKELESLVPAYNYNFIQRHILAFSIVITIIVALLFQQLIARFIRDLCLLIATLLSKSFLYSTYYLNKTRLTGKNGVKKVFANSIDKYYKNKKEEIIKQLNPQKADFIIKLLNYIKSVGSTDVPYTCTFIDKYNRDYKQYLKNLISYWQTRKDKDPDPEKIQRYIDYDTGLLSLDYVYQEDYKLITEYHRFFSGIKASDYEWSVSSEINKLFEKIMGDPIFKFIPNKKPESVPSPLNVFITLMNSVKYFTWNGEDYKKLNFPGVMLRFTISTKDSSGEHILWDKYLDPISKYSSQSVSVKDLYNEMIGSTIHTFSEQI